MMIPHTGILKKKRFQFAGFDGDEKLHANGNENHTIFITHAKINNHFCCSNSYPFWTKKTE